MQVAEYMLEHPNTAVLLKPGMRKTSITLAVIDALKGAKRANCAVVIAPRRVVHNVWPAEVRKWEEFKHLKVAICHGRHKEEAVRTKADLYVMTFEGFEWFAQKGHIARIKPKILVIDELSKYKHHSSKRSKTLKPYVPTFAYRYGLTGSVAANSLENVFGEMLVVDHGRTFGPYFTKFREEYFYPSGYGGHTWLPQKGAEKRIHAAMKGVAISLKPNDYIKIPKLVINDLKYELEPEVRKTYDEMEMAMLTYIAEHRVVAVNDAVASGKCRQIVSGAVYQVDKNVRSAKREVLEIHSEKFEILDEVLEELNGAPLAVVYEFEHELDRARVRYGKDLPAIHGGATDRMVTQIVDRWNRGEITHLWIQPQSGGHGLNMQEMSPEDIFGFTLPWDFEMFEQVIDRFRRSGNKAKHVRLHRPIAIRTVEERVMSVLGTKGATQERMMDALEFLMDEKGVKRLPSSRRK
jgi:hypothetical protein